MIATHGSGINEYDSLENHNGPGHSNSTSTTPETKSKSYDPYKDSNELLLDANSSPTEELEVYIYFLVLKNTHKEYKTTIQVWNKKSRRNKLWFINCLQYVSASYSTREWPRRY